MKNAKGILENLSRHMHMAEWKARTSKLSWGSQGVQDWGRQKGKESLHLCFINVNIYISEWDAKYWLADF